MKIPALTILLLAICFTVSAQKKTGYFNIGVSVFSNQEIETYFGPTLGLHVPLGDQATIGANFDIYHLQKDKIKMIPATADFRLYFKKLTEKASPFISVQPGYLLHNERIANGINRKGDFIFNVLAGIHIKPGKIGGTAGVGYSNIGFKTIAGGQETKDRFGGLKVFFAVAL